MIGFYDYTVVLTYVGALAGMVGAMLAFQGNPMGVLLCMAVSLFCDTLDGMVARRKKNRTQQEMLFGIQIDSLCDLISFGVCPCALFYTLGMNTPCDLLLLGGYCLCCVIRLGYFNVLAVSRELGTKGDYRGLPVVCLNVLTPAVYLVFCFAGVWALRISMCALGLLYILDFPVKKPNAAKLAAMAAVFWIPLGILAVVA